jgi:FKBP-type peptidyl-prolyl cis-trans isomerase
VSTMKRGGIRKVSVPADLGFGAGGAIFPDATIVPPNSALEIVVSLEEVSPSYL